MQLLENITEIYCEVDDFFMKFKEYWEKYLIDETEKELKRLFSCRLSVSEMMTIFILFHIDRYRTFKWFYKNYVRVHLKNICQIEHTRHRNPINFLVNLVSGLIAYSYFPKKPSLNWTKNEQKAINLLPGNCI